MIEDNCTIQYFEDYIQQRLDTDYKEKDWLYQKYILEQKSMRDISRIANASKACIHYWLKKYKIPRRKTWIAWNKGKKLSKEQIRKMSKAAKGRKLTEEQKKKIRKARLKNNPGGFKKGHKRNLGRKHPPEERTMRSKLNSLENNPNWKGGTSFEPYCHLFNFDVKEKFRNKYYRVCIICGISILQNGRRLSIHHIDENKMQGCKDHKWSLIPLCIFCHSKLQKRQNNFLLELLLFNNRQKQTHFGGII